jgi:acyl-CoA hydrolase
MFGDASGGSKYDTVNPMETQNSVTGKSPQESSVIMTELVLPSDTNQLGTIFGGRVMSWIDIAAAISAGRHARRAVVTASIDALHFVSPIKLGHFVHLMAQVNYAARTSMEVGVRVESENPLTGERTHTSTAYTTFVALSEFGKPVNVPPIIAATPEEIRRFEEAKKRREARMALAKDLKKAR